MARRRRNGSPEVQFRAAARGASTKPRRGKSKSPPKAGAKAKPGASEAKPIKVRKGEKVAVVLSGGNPRIAKADGDAPAQAYIAGMPGWKRDLARRPHRAERAQRAPGREGELAVCRRR